MKLAASMTLTSAAKVIPDVTEQDGEIGVACQRQGTAGTGKGRLCLSESR